MHFVFDLKLRRPGGPLLQMMQGGSVAAAQRFPEHLWLASVTSDLKLYSVDESHLDELVRVSLQHNSGA